LHVLPWLGCLTLALAVTPTPASQVRPVNLEQMTERAATIFAGRCLETTVALDPEVGLEVTTATFEVHRTVKGQLGSTVVVRMVGGEDRRARESIAGMPRFRPGDEVVLFLYAPSALGLSSPVGLGQGRFAVITDKQGRKIAVNDLDNRNLRRRLSSQARTDLGPALEQWKERKAVGPDALLDMVESLSFNTAGP